MDFLRPTFQAVNESVQALWVQLPPPIQQAAPFIGVGLGTGLIVFAVQQHRLKRQSRRGELLERQVFDLKKERAELLRRINTLKVKAGTPRTDIEARMAAAVAEATSAAAAAADAAARAATACIIQRPAIASGSGGATAAVGAMPPGRLK